MKPEVLDDILKSDSPLSTFLDVIDSNRPKGRAMRDWQDECFSVWLDVYKEMQTYAYKEHHRVNEAYRRSLVYICTRGREDSSI